MGSPELLSAGVPELLVSSVVGGAVVDEVVPVALAEPETVVVIDVVVPSDDVDDVEVVCTGSVAMGSASSPQPAATSHTAQAKDVQQRMDPSYQTRWGLSCGEVWARECLQGRGASSDAGAVIVFEVHLVPGSDGKDLLSAEVLKETAAQVMTATEAKAVGFDGFAEDPTLRLIAVTRRDQRWIEKALERAADVRGYRAHELDV